MQIVWQLGEASVSNFLEEIPELKPLYTTLASIIKNLEKKSDLTSKRYGNGHVINPPSPKRITKKPSWVNQCRIIPKIHIKKWVVFFKR